MRKQFVIFSLLTLNITIALAQKVTAISDVKLSGYGQIQYTGSDQEDSENNTFNLRIARVSLDGKAFQDFAWKLQFQANGNTSNLTNSLRVVDYFVEWQKHAEFKVKVGQYKRPFTFENPMNPIDQGFMSYGQGVTKLAGFSDRTGEHASNGRDLGLQFQGDFGKNLDGGKLIHYQVGIFNGQGINTKDVDNRKDFIGGFWVMPINGLRIGAFGWTGSSARKGDWTDQDGKEHKSEVRSLEKNRYAISAEYCADDWTVRSEYIHSQGYAFKTQYQTAADAKDCTINDALGDKSDAFYALAIAPLIKNKVHVKARYDLYRSTGEWDKAKAMYEIGADYVFTRNLQISAEYCRVNDRSLAKHDYNQFDVELAFRF
ncbi:MAG: porin [Prevotella sp.]|nr:porin [Prevotella sp.]